MSAERPRFNLVDEPWLPVVDASGAVGEVGLRALFTHAHELRDLGLPFGLEYAATLRMVVAVLQAATRGPRSIRQKAEWLVDPVALRSTIDEYLDRCHSRFELFDPERPFMQATVSGERLQPPAVLRPDWSSGNNATVFDHHFDARAEPLRPDVAARALLTTLLFQPGGGVSRPFNRTDSPGTKGIHVLVEAGDLWGTLVANTVNMKDDAPAFWERDGRDLDLDSRRVKRSGTLPDGWLDRATWRSRAVQLVPDEQGRVVGVRAHQHLKLADGPPFDPYSPIRRPEGKQPFVMRASPERALWRDSEALLQGLGGRDHVTVVAEALRTFEEAEIDGRPNLRLVGQVVNQAKVADVRDGRLPLLPQLLEEGTVVAVAGLVRTAEDGVGAFRRAAHDALVAMGAAEPWERVRRWETDLWAALGAFFPARVTGLEGLDDATRIFDEALRPWRGEVLMRVREAYGRFERGGGSGRSARAYGLGRAALERNLKRVHPREEHP